MTSEESSKPSNDSEPSNQEESQIRDESTQPDEPATSDATEDDTHTSEPVSTPQINNEKEEAHSPEMSSEAETTPISKSDEMGSDADTIPADNDQLSIQDRTQRNWSQEKSTHALAVELKRIETDVRNLLNNRDTKRKRKLTGTRRWQELEDDIISWKYTSKMDSQTILQLQELIARKKHLFTRLRFLASTRPTWNS